MASIRARSDNGLLFFDFRYLGFRCREQTSLVDTPINRQKMGKVLQKIDDEIGKGAFEYCRYFPDSKMLAKFGDSLAKHLGLSPKGLLLAAPDLVQNNTPLFTVFANQWFNEFSIGWRRSYKATVRQVLDSRLIPEFGDQAVGNIRREHILAFRSTLSTVRGRKESMLSPRRINAIVLVLRQVLNEAADRFYFTTPSLRIKPLKQKKADVHPFTLEEVNNILESVREDFRNYYTVRFFTGMRTGEIDGLKWKYIDFDRRTILVRETFTWNAEDYTKNDSSQRDIKMSRPVYDALKSQYVATKSLSEFVFCNRDGKPLDVNNVTKRVWYPLLRYLELEKRNPYQTRHTAATLWLASGEAPEWIARQLGHSNTEMLFRVYSRFVPNLTRQDGSAFERLLMQSGSVKPSIPSQMHAQIAKSEAHLPEPERGNPHE